MNVRERVAAIDPRQVQGAAFLALVYIVGWSLGRASGELKAAELVLAHGTGTRGA